MNWPEHVTKDGTLARGFDFHVLGFHADFIKTRGVKPFFGIERTDYTHISVECVRRDGQRRIFRASGFGHTLIVGRTW